MSLYVCPWCHTRVRNLGIGGFHYCADVPEKYLEGNDE